MGLLTVVRNHLMELRSRGTISYLGEYPHRMNIQNGAPKDGSNYEVDMVIAPRSLILDPDGLNRFIDAVFDEAFLGNPDIKGKEFTPFTNSEIHAEEYLLKIGDLLLVGDFGTLQTSTVFFPSDKEDGEAKRLLCGTFTEGDKGWSFDRGPKTNQVAMSISVRAYPEARIAVASTKVRQPAGKHLRYGWSEIDPNNLDKYR